MHTQNTHSRRAIGPKIFYLPHRTGKKVDKNNGGKLRGEEQLEIGKWRPKTEPTHDKSWGISCH